jgi:murein DD-endopeptidase MepM/ murein hydrolase activator NlpD
VSPDVALTFKGENRGALAAARETGQAIGRVKREAGESAQATVQAAAKERASLEKVAREYHDLANAAERGSHEQVAAAHLATTAERRLGQQIATTGRQARAADGHFGKLTRGAIAGSGAFRSFGRMIAFASGSFLGGAGLIYGLRSAKDAASNLVEQQAKSDVVFGKSATTVKRWADTTAGSFNIARDQALEYAGTFGGILHVSGLADSASAKLSKRLVELAADMASFNNASPEEALDALRSGLVGEAEPLRRFQVLLSESRVQAEALSSGIVKTSKDLGQIRDASDKVAIAQARANKALKDYGPNSVEAHSATIALHSAERGLEKALAGKVGKLTEAQKVQARYNLILKDTAVQQGDVARTAGSAANQEREAQKNWRNTQILIGTALLPEWNRLLKVGNAWLGQAENQERVQRAVTRAVDGFKAGIAAAWPTVKTLVGFVRSAVDAVGGLENAIKLLLLLKLGATVGGWAGALQKFAGAGGVGAATGSIAGKGGLAAVLRALPRSVPIQVTLTVIGLGLLALASKKIAELVDQSTTATARPDLSDLGRITPAWRKGLGAFAAEIPAGTRIKFDPRTGEFRKVFKDMDIGAISAKKAAEALGLSVEQLQKKVAGLTKTYKDNAAAAQAAFGPTAAVTGQTRATVPRGASRISPIPAGMSLGSLGGESAHGSRAMGNWQSDTAADFKAKPGTPALAVEDARITKVNLARQGQHSGKVFGAQVTMTGASGTQYFYTHIYGVTLRVGDTVRQGDIIGYVTEWADAPSSSHLHIGVSRRGGADTLLLAPSATLGGARTPPGAATPASERATAAQTGGRGGVGGGGAATTTAAQVNENKLLVGKIDQYLKSQGSPMAGMGAVFVAAGRKYGLDPRFLVALAGAESSFGKNCFRKFNPFGWGGMSFDSWEEAIHTVAKGLKEGYTAQGLTSVEQISGKYAPVGAKNDPTGLNRNHPRNVARYLSALGGSPADITFATGGGAAAIADVPLTVGKTRAARESPLIPLRLRQKLADAEQKVARARDGAPEREAMQEQIKVLEEERRHLELLKRRTGTKTAAGRERRLEITEALTGVINEIAAAKKDIADDLKKEREAAAKRRAGVGVVQRLLTGIVGGPRQVRPPAEEVVSERAGRERTVVRPGRIQLLDPVLRPQVQRQIAALKKTIADALRDGLVSPRELAAITAGGKRVSDALAKGIKLTDAGKAALKEVGASVRETLAELAKVGQPEKPVMAVDELTQRLKDAWASYEDAVKSHSKKATDAALAEILRLQAEGPRTIDAFSARTQAAQDRLSTGFGRLSGRILSGFDRQTQRGLAQIRRSVEGEVRAIQAAGQELTAGEGALAQFRSGRAAAARARQLAEIRQRIATAESPEDRAAAERELQELLLDEQEAGLEAQARAEREGRDRQTEEKVRAVEEAAAIQEQGYQDERDRLRQHLEDWLAIWQTGLADGSKTWAQFIEELKGQSLPGGPLEGAGLEGPIAEFEAGGTAAGSAWATAFIEELGAVKEELAAIAAISAAQPTPKRPDLPGHGGGVDVMRVEAPDEATTQKTAQSYYAVYTQTQAEEIAKQKASRALDWAEHMKGEQDFLAGWTALQTAVLETLRTTWASYREELKTKAAELATEEDWINVWAAAGKNAGGAFLWAFVYRLKQAYKALQGLKKGLEPKVEGVDMDAFEPEQPTRLQHGGRVPGAYLGREDTVDAKLTPGEEVIERSTAMILRERFTQAGYGGVQEGLKALLAEKGDRVRPVLRFARGGRVPERHERRVGLTARSLPGGGRPPAVTVAREHTLMGQQANVPEPQMTRAQVADLAAQTAVKVVGGDAGGGLNVNVNLGGSTFLGANREVARYVAEQTQAHLQKGLPASVRLGPKTSYRAPI